MKRANGTDCQYTVLETTEDERFYIDFMPQLWLIQVNNSPPLAPRDMAQFYFPRRLPQQSKDNYLRFVKQAKFICAKPQDDGKWELRKGRILQLGLGCLEEALNVQKYYSDYFSTTEAENEIAAAAALASASKKVVRKKKKAIPKTMCKPVESSESDDDENCGVSTISNYNVQFGTADQDLLTPGTSHYTLPIDIGSVEENNVFFGESVHFTLEQALTSADNLSEMFVSLDGPTTIAAAGVVPEERILESNDRIADDNIDSQNAQCNNCCKGHQKVLNKLDYSQKKFSNELSSIRHETASIRKLLQQFLQQAKRPSNDGAELESNSDVAVNDGIPNTCDQAEVNMIEFDQFIEKFQKIFPIKESDFIVDFNKTLKIDQKFADQLFEQLSRIKADDEIKTTRKILKKLCDFRCLKDFTWQGTKKLKSFQDLHLIVELIIKVLRGMYPGCDGMNILMKVVQQRTKSAKEAWLEFLKKNESPSVASSSVASPSVATSSVATSSVASSSVAPSSVASLSVATSSVASSTVASSSVAPLPSTSIYVNQDGSGTAITHEVLNSAENAEISAVNQPSE